MKSRLLHYGAALGLVLLAGCASHRATPGAEGVSSTVLPRLTNGMTGFFWGQPCRLVAQAEVEVEAGGRTFMRREFELVSGAGIPWLLVNGLHGRAGEWHLFRPPQLPPVFSPDDAALKRPGDLVVGDQIETRITELWRTRTLAVSGEGVLLGPTNQWLQGFTTRSTNEWMLIRWHPFRMWVHIGESLSEDAVFKGLGLSRAGEK
ncbi:MAG: hypothetical protein ACK45B_07850 [Limisphaerales bacterium]